jgi:hypothetical protein
MPQTAGTGARIIILRPFPKKIICGGQTGVDRAALDVALELRIPHGGWCPKGRLAEDGPIPAVYALDETDSEKYIVRTEWNVRDADGTLIINLGEFDGGTLATAEFARKYRKPLYIVDLAAPPAPAAARGWLTDTLVRILNVAGPRESKRPGIYRQAYAYLLEVLREE